MNFILLLTFLFPAQLHTSMAATTPKQVDNADIDTSRYAILPFNSSRDGFIFSKEFTPATVSDEDIRQLEKIISVAITEHNKQSKNKVDKPGKYYKQIIAVTNASGQKEVWVNCFCTPHEKRYWHKGVVMVLDGGPCFFNIKINLSTTTVMSLAVNGVA